MSKSSKKSAFIHSAPLWPRSDDGLSVSSRCKNFFEQIHQRNPNLNAYSELLEPSALDAAVLKDRLISNDGDPGPLVGLFAAVKDNMDTVPAVARAGLPFLADNRPETDSTVVKLLREAGAIVLGVTETDAGAFGITTPHVTNPVHPERYTGGSSGGSAAAVAAHLCDFAIGTDTGGSIRIPAACCGIFGFKPTVNTVSLQGVRPLTKSFDHVGPLACSIDMIESVMKVLSNTTAEKALGKSTIIGIPWSSLHGCDAAVTEALEDFAIHQKTVGLTVKDVPFPVIDDFLDVHIRLSLREAADLYRDLSEEHLQLLPAIAAESLEMGNTIDPAEIPELQQRRSALIAEVNEALAIVDYLVLPALPILPPKLSISTVSLGGKETDLMSAMIRFTAIFNQTGHPALAFPWIRRDKDIPIGLQLAGPKFSDFRLLEFARLGLRLTGLPNHA